MKTNNYNELNLDGKRIYEHRYVAELILGRQLKDGETVHHIDGDGHNNAPENIMVFRSNSDHGKFHRTGVAIKQPDGVFVAGDRPDALNRCLICNAPTNNDKYCSYSCYHLSRRKTERPNKEVLINLLKNHSFCAVGRLFGVSDNAIRKWLK